jgi:hypothetical protein
VARYTRDGELTAAHFVEYTLPGIYRVTAPTGPDFLAVNATRAESNFEKLQSADLQGRFRPLPVVLEEEEALGHAAAGSVLPLQELAGSLLLALIAVLAVENVCANRF